MREESEGEEEKWESGRGLNELERGREMKSKTKK